MGRQLTDLIRASAVEIEFGASTIAGITWGSGDTAVLLLHELDDDASADSWGALPDRLAAWNYAVLAIDLPGFGGTEGNPTADSSSAIEESSAWLRARGATRLFLIAAGGTAAMLNGSRIDALVLIAPSVSIVDPATLGTIPKLIAAGSLDPAERTGIKQFARACRGWTLLSSFAVENRMARLLHNPPLLQIETQVAGFFQDYRGKPTEQISRTERQTPR